ncbi:hypothetical protein IGL98_002697 [Enterococcus sp. DIV0840]
MILVEFAVKVMDVINYKIIRSLKLMNRTKELRLGQKCLTPTVYSDSLRLRCDS